MPTRPQNVTVIPADHLIVVDGQPLNFEFSAPSELHALHWDGSNMAIETISPDRQMGNITYPAVAYDTQVAPFVALWQAEQDRLTAEANKPSPPPTMAEKIAYLAEVRYEAEQGGTKWNGNVLQTDDRSQSKYLAELAAIDQGVRTDPSPWKLTDGFVLATNDDIKAMAITARAHVMACFAAEAEVLPLLGSLDSRDAVTTAFNAALRNIKQLDPCDADT